MPNHWYCILWYYLRAACFGKRRREVWAYTVKIATIFRLIGSVKGEWSGNALCPSRCEWYHRFPKQRGAKVMPKNTMPMIWHYNILYIGIINTVLAHFLLAKSKSIWFGIFHSHQYAGADDRHRLSVTQIFLGHNNKRRINLFFFFEKLSIHIKN